MRCYLHPAGDAVGVCCGCGRGVCSDCATDVGTRLSCGRAECLTAIDAIAGATAAAGKGVYTGFAFSGAAGLLLIGLGTALAIDTDLLGGAIIGALGLVFLIAALRSYLVMRRR